VPLKFIVAVCHGFVIDVCDVPDKDLKIPSVHSGEYRQIYKILAIKKKSKAPDHNVNTGKTAQRFHIRRSHWKMVKGVRKRIKWYCAGNIELGIIIKDYVIT
jgi:hypothetical protein